MHEEAESEAGEEDKGWSVEERRRVMKGRRMKRRRRMTRRRVVRRRMMMKKRRKMTTGLPRQVIPIMEIRTPVAWAKPAKGEKKDRKAAKQKAADPFSNGGAVKGDIPSAVDG